MKIQKWMLGFGMGLSLVLLTGCGGDDSKDSTGGGGAFTAPKTNEEAKKFLVGAWTLESPEIDEAKVSKMFPAEMPADRKEAAIKQMKEMVGNMSVTMTMKEDGTSVSDVKAPGPDGKIKEKTEKGTWEVTKVDGKVVTLKTTEEKNGQKKEESIEITLLGKNSFQITKAQEMDEMPIKFVLKRK